MIIKLDTERINNLRVTPTQDSVKSQQRKSRSNKRELNDLGPMPYTSHILNKTSKETIQKQSREHLISPKISECKVPFSKKKLTQSNQKKSPIKAELDYNGKNKPIFMNRYTLQTRSKTKVEASNHKSIEQKMHNSQTKSKKEK